MIRQSQSVRVFALCGLMLATAALPALAANQPRLWKSYVGPHVGAYYGVATGSAGDFDGDGYGDFLIAAPQALASSGVVHLYFGGATAPTSRLVFQGLQDSDMLGSAVGSAGTFDNDSFEDLVLCQQGGQSQAWVYLGGSRQPAGVSFLLRPRLGSLSTSDPDAWGTFCSSVSHADLDGDGLDEVIVGAPQYRDSSVTNGASIGRVYVFNGRALSGPVETYSDLTLHAGADRAPADRFGEAVLGVGDLDGDGFEDFVVGAPGLGKVYFYAGSASGPTSTSVVFSEPPGGFGSTLATGDVDGDGKGDLVISGADPYGTAKAYVYYGGAGRFNTTADRVYRTSGSMNLWGQAVAVVDQDDDGQASLLVGDPSVESDPSVTWQLQGRVYDLEDGFRFDGDAWGDMFGFSLSGLGDVNGDGVEDWIVGAPQNSAAGAGYARVYLGFKRTPPPPCGKCPIPHETDPGSGQ